MALTMVALGCSDQGREHILPTFAPLKSGDHLIYGELESVSIADGLLLVTVLSPSCTENERLEIESEDGATLVIVARARYQVEGDGCLSDQQELTLALEVDEDVERVVLGTTNEVIWQVSE